MGKRPAKTRKVSKRTAHAIPDDEAIRRAAQQEVEACRRIGRFIYQFSQLEFTIQVVLGAHLKLDQELASILAANLDFARTCNILKSVSKITLKDHPEKLKGLTKALDEALALNSNHRLPVAHALWTPGGASGLTAHRLNKTGGPPKYHYEDGVQLEKAADQAQELMMKVWVFP